MDEKVISDVHVVRETVAHLHTLAIEQNKRTSEIERHVRDIKAGVVLLLIAVVSIAYHIFTR